MSVEINAPRDHVERDLVTICEDILGIHPVGVRDNLFDLGTDSLAAQRLISGIEKVFNQHLAPAVLFHYPTIEQIADLLCAHEDREAWSSLVPIQTTGSRPPFFWIHGDMSSVFLSRVLGSEQ